MSEGVRVQDGEIFVGKALAWPAYDRNGRLLLQRGEVIASRKQLEILLKRGLYRHDHDRLRDEGALVHAEANPFEVLAGLRQRVAGLAASIARGQPESKQRAHRLAKDLQRLCEQGADAALGSIHLCQQSPYSVCHPLHSAILCELVGQRIGFEPAQRISLIGAALTQNLAMAELQDRLFRQRESLDQHQQAEIHGHPQRAVQLLQQAGIDDPVWLTAVAQHHERLDGSGYPARLSGDAVTVEARLLAVTDRYTAMVSDRAYRAALSAKTALRHFFDADQQHFDPQFSVMLIKELGIYPPGSWVRLVNGEIGMVVKRNHNATQPTVSAVLNPRGGGYVRPMRRDGGNEKFRVAEVVAARALAFDPATVWGYQ